MKCPKCKKINVDGSRFCQFCGSKLATETKPEVVKEKNKADAVWDKFGTIYDSKDEERKKFMDLTSDEAWDLITSLSKINFESFIEENKTELNKYPYRILDSLKNKYYWCFAGGYLGWIAEALVNGVELIRIVANKDNLFKDWRKLALDNYPETYKTFNDEFKNLLNRFVEFEINLFLDNDENVKNLSVEFVDKLRLSFAFNIIYGYVLGMSEAKQRKG